VSKLETVDLRKICGASIQNPAKLKAKLDKSSNFATKIFASHTRSTTPNHATDGFLFGGACVQFRVRHASLLTSAHKKWVEFLLAGIVINVVGGEFASHQFVEKNWTVNIPEIRTLTADLINATKMHAKLI
jgi:hypothetical protein